MMVFANDGIQFPVAKTATRIDNGRTLLDGELIGDVTATGIDAIALLALLLAA